MDDDDHLGTRVFVTGLPPTLNSEDLGKHFATRFPITDAHVLPGRRIGFVGFQHYATAKSAIKYFNKSYIRMSKIGVDLAKPIELEKSNGQQARPVSAKRFQSKQALGTNPTADSPKGSTFEQYTPITKGPGSLKRKRDDGRNPSEERTERAATPPQVVTDGLNVENRSQALSKEDRRGPGREQEKPFEILPETQTERGTLKAGETGQNPTEIGIEEGTDEAQPSATRVTDDDAWLRSKTSRILDIVDEDEIDSGIPPSQVIRAFPATPEPDERSDPTSEAGAKLDDDKGSALTPDFPATNRLFVRNLPYAVDEQDLLGIFSSKFPGKITEVHLVKDHRTNNNKGFAYISCTDDATARAAALDFDGKPLQGRIMHVLPATERQSTRLDEFELSKLPLKKQKLIKRKQEAGKHTLSWNSLYMNPDAVISSIAERLGVAKSQVLDPTSSDAAVKQAQAETHVIEETKAYFTKYGVNFDAFENQARGGRALLVKNLAFGTSADELKALFNICGEVTRLLLPPSGVIAIVEFADLEQAQRAMKQLAYRNVKGSPLYLEKAPRDVFASTSTAHTDDKNKPAEAETTKDGADTSSGSSTLFVRNLNFATTSAGLTETFKPLEGFLSARVKTRTDAKRPGETLSMGYGFVQFRTAQQAQVALKAMNGYRLDNHELLVRISQQATDAAEERRREDAAHKESVKKTKIIIKNLPFEATKKDIRSLFGAYGQLRSVRVPQKFDRSTRGFAFAEFVTVREAENAMDALKNTHLLGRRLVLDFAAADASDPEAEIKAMEKKVGRQAEKVEMQRLTQNKRRKFVLGAQDDEMDDG